MSWLRFWLWLTAISSMIVVAAAETDNEEGPPPYIKLKAGVLHAPPFAWVEERFDGSPYYTGFQVDLLDRLAVFAKEDNVLLEFDLSTSPTQYGDALDLVAKDCNTTKNPNALEDCQQLDLIVGDYYCNPERSLRIDFTPSWLRTTMSTVKYQAPRKRYHQNNLMLQEEYTTLTQAAAANATVCVPEGTYLMHVVMGKFPGATYLKCPSADDCVEALKNGQCVLFADDELLLGHRASEDPTLEVTREQFNTQYLVWPMRRDLPEVVSEYMKKWMYAAVANATLDDLYFEYFQKELCPVGTAGKNCELPCHPVHGTNSAEGICVCDSTKWTGDDCSIEVLEETNMIPLTLKVLVYVMLGINLLLIAGCGTWLFWQRTSAQVMVSQPFFLALVLLGCCISSCTIIALAKEDEGEGTVPGCMAIPWLYSVGFSITFGTLFAKIRRVYSLFRVNASAAASRGVLTRRNSHSSLGSSSMGRRKTTSGTFKETLAIIVLVLLVDCVILVWWTIMSPLEWERTVISADQFGVPLESHGHCTSDDWVIFAAIMAVFHLTLLCVGCYMCYAARNIPTQFHEGKAVSIAMVSNFQIFLVGVPILIVLGSAPQSSFFVRAVIIWMNDLVVITLIFGNLIYSVHFEIESAEPEAVKAAIGHAIQQFATGERRSGERRSGERRSTPKGSQTSGTTPPAKSVHSSMQSEQVEEETFKETSRAEQGQEIALNWSALEQNCGYLRRGESYCNRRPPSQSTPLPRSLMASSVDTHVHGNLTTRSSDVHSTNRSSHAMSNMSTASDPFSSTASVCAMPRSNGEDGFDDGRVARTSAPKQRQSWLGLGMTAMFGDSTSSRLGYLDQEQQGCHTIVEGRSTDAASASSAMSKAKLPPVDLPEGSPTHLAYAASRIGNVRDNQEKTWQAREDSSETDSRSTGGSTIATGTSKFIDEASSVNSAFSGRNSSAAYSKRASTSKAKKWIGPTEGWVAPTLGDNPDIEC